MKRMHIHIAVNDLDTSKRFYSALLGAEPTISKADYAKWQLDDPRVNLALSAKPDNADGVNHLGIQAENESELKELYDRLGNASVAMLDQRGARCCYAESDKHWAMDPDGIPWEMFFTMGEVTVYGEDRARDLDRQLSASDSV